MGEQELLFRVLDTDEVGDAEVKHWLDDAFGVHELGDDRDKHLKFKQYDPLSFVVTILNFLREDTAPLLAPSGERSQTISHSSPASAVAKESVEGEWKSGGVKDYRYSALVARASRTAAQPVHYCMWCISHIILYRHWPKELAMVEEHVIYPWRRVSDFLWERWRAPGESIFSSHHLDYISLRSPVFGSNATHQERRT